MTLIEQLEAAPEGSRELDRSLAVEWGWVQGKDRGYTHIDGHHWYDPQGRRLGVEGYLHYTTSMDAAWTLVSEGWFIQMLDHAHSRIVYLGDIHEPLGWNCWLQRIQGGLQQRGRHKTEPALALCIAALKVIEVSAPLCKICDCQGTQPGTICSACGIQN